MSFNASVPLSTDSPSLFPSQNQTNMSRLQTIVSADHQFNLSATADDGYHNLIHMTQQAPTGALAATGRLYVKTATGLIQLFYMDDAGTEYQLTPQAVTEVSKISGSQSLAAGASTTISIGVSNYTGFGTVYVTNTNSQSTYNFMRSGASVDINELDFNSGVVSRPTLAYLGTNLRVTNNSGSAQTVVWSLMVNKL